MNDSSLIVTRVADQLLMRINLTLSLMIVYERCSRKKHIIIRRNYRNGGTEKKETEWIHWISGSDSMSSLLFINSYFFPVDLKSNDSELIMFHCEIKVELNKTGENVRKQKVLMIIANLRGNRFLI